MQHPYRLYVASDVHTSVFLHINTYPFLVFQGNGGGRIIVLQAALPNVGPGKCQLLDETRGNDTTFEALANSPQAKFYNDVAIECTKRSVVVDLFFCSSEYVSIATIGAHHIMINLQ